MLESRVPWPFEAVAPEEELALEDPDDPAVPFDPDADVDEEVVAVEPDDAAVDEDPCALAPEPDDPFEAGRDVLEEPAVAVDPPDPLSATTGARWACRP